MNLVGKVLFNQYRVDAFIAAGGMSAVYKVWDLNRRVYLAMKVLHADFAEDEHTFKRFQREAEVLKAIRHPNIVRFYGAFRIGNQAVILEQFIDGVTLREFMRRRKPLSRDEVLAILKSVSSALAYAHNRGVVHCDVKPENVMIDRGGQVFLTDFGIARHADSTATTALNIGTAAYMAPEQIKGEKVLPQTDVYSLGVMAYELLAGRRPFRSRDVAQGEGNTAARVARLQMAHLQLQPPNPRTFNPNLPENVGEALLKALAKDPHERPKDAWEFFKSLSVALGANPQETPTRLAGIGNLLAESDDEETLVAPPNGLVIPPDDGATLVEERHKRIPVLVWGMIAGVLVLCLGTGIAFALTKGKVWNVGGKPTPVVLGDAGEGATSAAVAPIPTNTPRPTDTPIPTPTLFPTNTPVPTATPSIQLSREWQPCPDAPPSRLHEGEKGRVTFFPDQPNNVRRSPSLSAKILGQIYPGEVFKILGGPACGDALVWWKVRSLRTGLIGWTAEGDYEHYWLEPLH